MARTKVTLPNGIKLEGDSADPAFKETLAKLIEVVGADAIDDGKIYMSASKGATLISDMATPWLKNTICKLYRDWAAELSEVKSPVVFLKRLRSGPDSKTMLGLIEELATRR